MTLTCNNTVCDINATPGTYQRLRDEGCKVSMNTLRGWVRNGTLAHDYSKKLRWYGSN